jgi:proteasome assembly chaperone (PAC2) family protein
VRNALRFFVRPTLDEPLLVLAYEGWNDAGDAGTWAARYLASTLHAVPLADIDPEDFYDFTVRRPQAHVESGVAHPIEWPRSEFLFTSLPSGREIVIGIGVEPHTRWRGYVQLVARLAKQLKIRRVILLGAFLADVLYSRPVRVSGLASSAELLEGLGVEPANYQGPTGIVGVLTERLREEGLEFVSLWAGLPHYISVSPNPRGALALLQKLETFLDVRFDYGPIQREAVEFEERVSALVAGDPELSEYVRQLKRREFAQ